MLSRMPLVWVHAVQDYMQPLTCSLGSVNVAFSPHVQRCIGTMTRACLACVLFDAACPWPAVSCKALLAFMLMPFGNWDCPFDSSHTVLPSWDAKVGLLSWGLLDCQPTHSDLVPLQASDIQCCQAMPQLSAHTRPAAAALQWAHRMINSVPGMLCTSCSCSVPHFQVFLVC